MKKRLTISLLFLCALVAAASPKGGTFNSRDSDEGVLFIEMEK